MVASPCIKQCRLVDGICQGCRRHIEEIIAWRDMTDAERLMCLERIAREPQAQNQS